eukprot:566346-Rhodomonas_salina.5
MRCPATQLTGTCGAGQRRTAEWRACSRASASRARSSASRSSGPRQRMRRSPCSLWIRARAR